MEDRMKAQCRTDQLNNRRGFVRVEMNGHQQEELRATFTSEQLHHQITQGIFVYQGEQGFTNQHKAQRQWSNSTRPYPSVRADSGGGLAQWMDKTYS